MASSKRISATLIGVVAILLWAMLAVLTTQAGAIPPFQLMTLSFGIALVGGIGVLAIRGRAALAEMRPIWKPFTLAFIGIFGYHALYFFALQNAPVAEASTVAYLWPLLIVVFSALLAGKGGRIRYLAGSVLGFSGTGLILLGNAGQNATDPPLIGYAAALACALVWATYSLVNRRFKGTPAGMMVGVCGAVAGAAMICHEVFETTVVLTGQQWFAVVALGLGPTGVAFLAWDHATKHGNLALLGALSYLSPLLSTVLLVLTSATSPTLNLAISAILVIGGSISATGISWTRLSASGTSESL